MCQVVEDGQVPLEKTLTKILVEMLLDPTTSLPLDVDSMHKKMLRGPAAEWYVCKGWVVVRGVLVQFYPCGMKGIEST